MSEAERLASAGRTLDTAVFTVVGRAPLVGAWATEDKRALLAHGELVQLFDEPEQIAFAADRKDPIDRREAKVLKREIECGPPVGGPSHHARERGAQRDRALTLCHQRYPRTNANSHSR